MMQLKKFRALVNWLSTPRVLKRIAYERLAEPLHLNLASIPVALFGSVASKIAFDLVPIQPYACGLLEAARIAKRHGYNKLFALEFGVASGRGLLNLCYLAESLRSNTGVEIEVVGFDGGIGLPDVVDFRDHPDIYQPGDYRLLDEKALRAALPAHGRLEAGAFRGDDTKISGPPSSHVAHRVCVNRCDLYSSTVLALTMLQGRPEQYLPETVVFFDDICEIEHNDAAGERLAINEFNQLIPQRRLQKHWTLKNRRFLKNAWWLDQIYLYHVMDHAARSLPQRVPERTIPNPYLTTVGGKPSATSSTRGAVST